MHHKASRLVDNDQVPVLIDDIQGDVLGDQSAVRALGYVRGKDLPVAADRARFEDLSV